MKQGVVLSMVLMVLAAWPAAGVDIGSEVSGLTFKDIRYLPRTLEDFGPRKAFVFAFTSLDDETSAQCLRRLSDLQGNYGHEPVEFIAINVGADDTVMEIAEQALLADARYTVVKDMDGSCAAALGVKTTPTVVLMDGDHQLRYRGTISGAAMALEALLSDAPIEVVEAELTGRPLRVYEAPPAAEPVTFAKHIAPILHAHCVSCHRPGEGAPFSLLTYGQAQARADMIAEVAFEERMPPWYASRAHGDFINERQLTQVEKDRLAQWVRAGMPRGDMSIAPAPPVFPDIDWHIGEPDLVLTAPKEIDLPAEGYIPYEYVTLPYQFPADTWIQGLEIRPSNPDVVHHANLVFTLPGKQYDGDRNFLTGRVPGGRPVDLEGPVAMRIPRDAVLTLQIHYVTTGKPEKDQIQVGVRYAKEPIQKAVHYRIIRPREVFIPAGDAFHEMSAERIIDRNATAIALFSHMHLRGRDMTFTAAYPDGTEEKLLTIPNYSFDWQLAYLFAPGARQIPKGTRIRTVSHYDNSAFNPYNPDPSVNVEYGPQTYHEMNDAYFFFLDNDEQLSIQVDPATGQEVGVNLASN